MANVKTTVKGEQALRDFFKKAPSELRQALRKEIDRLALMLLARMKEKVGGQVLKVRTGRLRRSISIQERIDDKDGYRVVVGTNVKYAAAHEYGFTGSVSVPAHMRTVRKAFGRPVRNPTQHMVRQHARRVRLPERSFARSSLRELEGQMSATLQTFITNTLRSIAP